jgi:hypothetical protein
MYAVYPAFLMPSARQRWPRFLLTLDCLLATELDR